MLFFLVSVSSSSLSKSHCRRIGHDLICDRMAQLLNGHRVLAYGFNQFLPGGFGVVLTEESDYAQRVKV